MRGGEGGKEVGKGQGTGEWKGRGRDARERGGKERVRDEEGDGEEKIITPPSSIPAYAPV